MHSRLVHRFAYGISQVFCPPCVAIGGMVLAAAAHPSPKGWLCAGTYILLAVLGPLLTLFWLMSHGEVSDLDVTRRQERHKPFIAAVCGAAVAWRALSALEAPDLQVQFAAAHTAVISIVVVVTLYWKISVHAAGAASLATLVSALLEAKLLAVLPVPVLVVSWSRFYLGRHTLAQVVAGGILGAVVFGSFLLVR